MKAEGGTSLVKVFCSGFECGFTLTGHRARESLKTGVGDSLSVVRESGHMVANSDTAGC